MFATLKRDIIAVWVPDKESSFFHYTIPGTNKSFRLAKGEIGKIVKLDYFFDKKHCLLKTSTGDLYWVSEYDLEIDLPLLL